jgi:hypothetical protein
MAFKENVATRTYVSGSAITQYRFVTLASDGQVDHTGAGLRADGVALFAAGAAGVAIPVVYDGRVQVEAEGVISRGGAVASDAAGKGIAAVADDVILGYALETSADGQIITVELSRAETVVPTE